MKKSKYSIISTLILVIILSNFSILNASDSSDFLTLKNNQVNLRQGPSFEHPIKLIYKKKYLPVIVTDASETWRKIIDFENNSGWIHISQLSKKKSAINIKNGTLIYKKPTIFSKPIAKLEIGRLMIVKKCKIKWCKVTSGKYGGWIKLEYLWGKIK
tara:strand:- start:256 stop:726 length:471 start_codon:yes stop_codon:yes gene_type:complete